MAEKYLNLSGLQAFYDKLKTTAFIDSALSIESTKPLQNKIVAQHFGEHETDLTTLKNASGTWNDKQDKITDLDSIRNSAKSGWSAWSAVTENSGTWATDTNIIAAMTDVATYFNGTSALSALTAKSALSAGSASKAAALSNTAYKVASATSATKADTWTNARTIAASGDVTWSITTSGSSNVTGNATINSIPSSAISSVPWSAIDDYAAAVDTTTTDKFTTPKAVNDAITAAMTTKAAFKGPYSARSAIPSTELDKLSIYLIGPSGSGVDKYEEWVLTGTTTAQMLQIGDTSTNLSDYLKTTTFNSWSGGSNSKFNGSASKAGTATSADNASRLGGVTATTVTGNAASGAAASAWIIAHSGDYASASHDHAYTLSGAGTALNISAGINLKPNGNIAITTAANTINISAKDTTYTSLNAINTSQYAALTAVSGLTGVKNYGTIAAKSGTTSKGTFTPSTSADTFNIIAGNNIDFVSGANSLTISAKTYSIPTVNNSTIKITTGASPATGQFTLNQSSTSTITLGSMALKASSDYIAVGSMVPYTSAEVTAGITW